MLQNHHGSTVHTESYLKSDNNNSYKNSPAECQILKPDDMILLLKITNSEMTSELHLHVFDFNDFNTQNEQKKKGKKELD